ncbi:hypothetical protein BC938DRAFT_474365 [Jimgerdemannia flammicorona]|uniref:Uncharacterized protein n=1 Tax=Jimgerdemannia flammicorona TaxID=994334 RepID=A0A433QSK7_9FUNG|nr:hypothetical protein BC938DRAFT_474365 [Jimgerdemannia flammicorona]
MLFEQPPLPHPGADRPFTPHPTPTPNPSPPQPTRPSSPTSAFTAFLLTSPFRPDERALWRLILRALADDDPVTLRSHLDAADPIAAIHVLLACSHQNGPTSPGGSGHYSFDPELIPESTKLLGAAIGPLNAVQLACMAGAEDCALQLLEFLATASRDVMRSDRPVHVMMDQEWGEGNTALHLASFNALPQVVTRLLRLGANPNRRNGKGLRPVDCADESCSAAFWEIGEGGFECLLIVSLSPDHFENRIMFTSASTDPRPPLTTISHQVVTRSKGALTDSASQSDEEDDDEDTDRSDAQGDGSFTEPSDDDDEHTRANEQRAKHHTLATRTKSPLIEPNNKNRENRTKTIESKPVMREIAPVAQGSNITKTGT